MVSDFTLKGFRAIILAALPHYSVIPFRDVDLVATDKPFIIMRHDVDHSLHQALILAREEHRLGVAASYMVLVGTPFYNVLTTDSKSILREIASLGHEVGLHYEWRVYPGDEAEQCRHFRQDIGLLEQIVGRPVVSASCHDPSGPTPANMRTHIKYDAYFPEFFSAIHYLSDSNHSWRQWHPLELINQRKSFQLLLHPLWWTVEGDGWEEKLRQVETEAQRHLCLVFAETIQYQRESIMRRAKRDQSFLENHKRRYS